MEEKLIEVLEETSHETARQQIVKLSIPNVCFLHKAESYWYHIARIEKGLFPHQFYVQCQKEQITSNLQEVCGKRCIGGAYLTQVYQGEKFNSLTLGVEVELQEEVDFKGLEKCLIPESDYLVVNVPPYQHYELGAHVLAAWNVFTEFDYERHHLKRDLDHAPIYEWDSKEDGYTLYFPIKKYIGGRT